MKSGKRILIGLLIIFALVMAVILIPKNRVKDFHEKYADAGDMSADVEGISRSNTYSKYLEDHSAAPFPGADIIVDITDYSASEGIELLQEYEGADNVISTAEASFVEWPIDVPEAGMYQVYMEYYPVISRGVDIERKFYINGAVPFVGADSLSFTRLWADESAVTRDNQGNDIRPTQIDIPEWTGEYFKDDLGYYAEPYTFYFEKGANTIGLEAVNEPVMIKSLTLRAVKDEISYTEYQKSTPAVTASEGAANYLQVIQGEAATLRSSPSLYSIYDRSSPSTTPSSVSKIRLNMIGGNAWRIPGQWIEWECEVPEDGYYGITIKGRQNYNRGFVSSRSVYIDGEIPFSELKEISFQYSSQWEAFTLSDENQDPYRFYLAKGKHTIRLEVTLGGFGKFLNELQDSVYRLNYVYRKILVLTGTAPDRYRDYKIAQLYPEVMEAMALESKRLYKLVDDITAYSGQKAGQVATTQTLAQQLERFVGNPDKIPKSFVNFKDNITALGASIQTMSEAPLDIDYITVTGINAKPEAVKETFFDKTAHEVKSFGASFVVDYNAVGDVYDKSDAIEVWILSGRDQSTILKTMIDDTFTPDLKIKVNVKLVDAGTVLNAVIAGMGPDVVLSAGQGEPVNYALRNAVEDLTQFEGYKEVLKDFYPSAYSPYYLDGGIYALPETQNFDVMFYRKDIMEELGLQVPQTWEDLISILPIIQQNNMSVGIPSTERLINNSSNPDLSGYLAMLYQNGGTVYNQDGTRTVIDEESGISAFEKYTQMFTHYQLPKIYDFVNRFRSGEMPIGIIDYNAFNTLVVFAPEIRGLWDFTVIPGTLQADGKTINRSCHTWGSCSMMLKQDNENTKQKAWEFMKWWASADTQLRFGQEMESVMGASARYATANMNAFERLAWNNTQLEILKEQWKWAVGYREIAGGYYTSRHMINAVRKVINSNEDPRETLLDYARTINEEIIKKRAEFGLK